MVSRHPKENIVPALRPVHCPTCACSTDAAVLHTVPGDLKVVALAPKHALRPGDKVHVCDRCPGCGTIWCVITARMGRVAA